MMKNVLLLLCIAGILFLACGKQGGTPAGQVVDGAKVYKQYCILCHGADGKLGVSQAKDLTASKLTEAERIVMVTEGKNTMTPFKGVLSPEEIKAVVAYTFTLK